MYTRHDGDPCRPLLVGVDVLDELLVRAHVLGHVVGPDLFPRHTHTHAALTNVPFPEAIEASVLMG